MLGFMNREAMAETQRSGLVTFWRRTRQTLWTKGETSGNRLRVEEIRPDCHRDALLVVALPEGPTCHTGALSCFGRDQDRVGLEFLGVLERLIQSWRRQMPEDSYTAPLFRSGLPHICRKLGEETVETIVSAMQDRQSSVGESADLLYHLLVFLTQREISLRELMEELSRRHRV